MQLALHHLVGVLGQVSEYCWQRWMKSTAGQRLTWHTGHYCRTDGSTFCGPSMSCWLLWLPASSRVTVSSILRQITDPASCQILSDI